MIYIMIIIDDIVAPPQFENGVKQGGVLSPTLFCIYFDELLRRLRETDVGCHVGHMSYAAFGYADDLLLLSPSIHGLEILVKTSESFASEYGVTFNAKKTECICFSKNACPLQRQVNNNNNIYDLYSAIYLASLAIHRR